MFFKLLYYRLLLEELRKERGFNGLIQYNKKRQEEAKKKVLIAMQELKQNGENVSIRKVARRAGVSVNTARKYLKIVKNT